MTTLLPRLPRLALILSVSVALLAGCTGSAAREEANIPLSVRLKRIDVEEAAFEQLRLVVRVSVSNPSGSDVLLEGGEVSVVLQGPGAEVEGEVEGAASDAAAAADLSGVVTGERFSGAVPAGTLAAAQETEVPVRVVLPLPVAPEALAQLLSWRRLTLKAEGTLSTSGGTETFRGAREVASPVIPRVVLKEAQVASVDGGEKGAVYFSLGLDNPNPFPVAFENLVFQIRVGDKEMRVMEAGTTERVPPASETVIEESIQLDDESYGPELRKLLRQTNVPYQIAGSFQVQGIDQPFRFVGEMVFAR